MPPATRTLHPAPLGARWVAYPLGGRALVNLKRSIALFFKRTVIPLEIKRKRLERSELAYLNTLGHFLTTLLSF